MTADRIPVLDIGDYLAGARCARQILAEAVSNTCDDTGFLVITNHSIDPSLIDGAFAAAADFFDLNEPRKLELKLGDLNIGYLPYGAQIVRTSKLHTNTKPNYGESFYIVADKAAEDPDIASGCPPGNLMYGLNQWPHEMPSFRARTMEYFEAMRLRARWYR